MRKAIAGLACAMTLACPAAYARDAGWKTAGEIGRDVLIAAAVGIPAVNDDWNGALQAGGSVGGAALVTYGLKEAFPETRPDGSDRKSFPSGHASMAFAAAATIQNREGWEAGLPAQAVAIFVAYSRVEAHKHHWYDVVAGAAIGEASGFLITNRRDSNVRVMPWGDGSGAGVVASINF